MNNEFTAIGKSAIRAVLASHALTLRALTHELDDPDFRGASLESGPVVGTLRRIASELEQLRDDVQQLVEKEQA